MSLTLIVSTHNNEMWSRKLDIAEVKDLNLELAIAGVKGYIFYPYSKVVFSIHCSNPQMHSIDVFRDLYLGYKSI